MRQFSLALLLILATAGTAAQRPRRPGAPVKGGPDLTILGVKVSREPKLVIVEGSLRNSSDRRLNKVTVYFVFLESGGQTITRKNIGVQQDVLEPGDETTFLGQTADPVRAVWVKLEAADKDGRHLTIDKPGPYDIE